MMWSRLSPAMVWCVLLCAAQVVVVSSMLWLWQHGINTRVEGLRNERFRFSLLDMKTKLEAELRLGNSTTDLAGASTLIQQVRDRQPDVLSIDIYDSLGQVLFSTDSNGQGLMLPATWRQPCLKTDASGWSATDSDVGVQCVGLVNAFGQNAGGLLLRHRRVATDQAGWSLTATLPGHLAFALGCVALASWLAYWRYRPLRNRAHAARLALASEPTPESAREGEPMDDLGPATAAAHAMAVHREWLAQADAEADRLDNLETT